MSFSHEVKDELLEVRLRRNEDGRMLVSGYTLAIAALKYSRAHRTWGLHYVSEYSPGIGFAANINGTVNDTFRSKLKHYRNSFST